MPNPSVYIRLCAINLPHPLISKVKMAVKLDFSKVNKTSHKLLISTSGMMNKKIVKLNYEIRIKLLVVSC